MATWSVNCENALNRQINLEFHASYAYHYLFSHFNKNSIGLDNIANFFNKCSLEEREHAHKLIEYQNKRGGTVVFSGINIIDSSLLDDKTCTVESFRLALQLEQKVYESLLSLHKIADSAGDPQFADFLEGEYLEEQINAIDELKRYISRLELIGDNGHGIWNFNQEFENK